MGSRQRAIILKDYCPTPRFVTDEYNGKTAVKINAPATPTITAERTVGILGILATPKTIIPAINDARDLWSRRIGTESKTPLILGTKKGAIKLADITAMIAGSRTTPDTLLPIPLTDTIKEFKIFLVYLIATHMVVPN